MSRALGCLLLGSLIFMPGCGQSTVDPEDAYKPEQFQGVVDTGLPPPARAKQQALKAILDSVHELVGFDELPYTHPGIRFAESRETFFEGTLGLHGWRFDGPPVGDDVPVLLQLYEDSAGERIREVKRVYTVTDARGRVDIRRKR